jgi:hypothetical protein
MTKDLREEVVPSLAEVIAEARAEEIERCARIADDVREEPAEDGAAAGVWRLACSEI